MRRTFKYRLEANNKTIGNCERWLELCRMLYNVGLEQRITWYKQNKRIISCYEQMNQLPELKQEFPEYKEVGAQCLQEVLERLDNAYHVFFNRRKRGDKAGYPRFKGKGRYDSFTLKQCNWKLEGKYLVISRIGRFKLRLSRPINGDIKQITIRRTNLNRWYACFFCDNVPKKELPRTNKDIGIDVGIKSFCVDSDGVKVFNPLYMKQAEKELRRKQRRLSRRKKGSSYQRSAKAAVGKLYEKIKNQKDDYFYKIAREYVAENDIICVEDLNIETMIMNPILVKLISDSSWGRFFDILICKAEEANREIIKVKPHNTTQNCSSCGNKVNKSLSVRIHSCPYCGLVMDRDENAALNILKAGRALRTVISTEVDIVCKSPLSYLGERQGPNYYPNYNYQKSKELELVTR